jgi:hypothetical protein
MPAKAGQRAISTRRCLQLSLKSIIQLMKTKDEYRIIFKSLFDFNQLEKDYPDIPSIDTLFNSWVVVKINYMFTEWKSKPEFKYNKDELKHSFYSFIKHCRKEMYL